MSKIRETLESHGSPLHSNDTWRVYGDVSMNELESALEALQREAVIAELQAELDTLMPQGVSSNPRDYVGFWSEAVNRLNAHIAALKADGGDDDKEDTYDMKEKVDNFSDDEVIE